MGSGKSLLRVAFRARRDSYGDTNEEKVVCELSDRSLEQIRRLITPDRLSPSDLGRRLEWTLPQGRNRRHHGSPPPPQQ